MKRLAIIVAVLLVSSIALAGKFSPPSPGDKESKQAAKEAAVAKKQAEEAALSALKVFSDEPDCKYQILSPVSERARSAEDAFEKAKKAAVKLGADAIIKMTTGTSVVGVPTTIGYGSLMVSQPTVSGIAVKFLGPKTAK